MAGTDLYASIYFALDGQLMTEEQEITWNFDPANTIVKTQQKGFAGVSQGAGGLEVTVVSAVPRAGTEIDFIKLAADATPVEGIIIQGAKKLVSKGFMMDVSGKGGVDQLTTVSFKFSGSVPQEI